MTTPAQHLQQAAAMAAAGNGVFSTSLQPSTSGGGTGAHPHPAPSNVSFAAPAQQQQSQQIPVKRAAPKLKASLGGGNARREKGDKKTRSRLACLACKSTKQKCDGPSRVPCRRCELYGLECKFPPGAGVVAASAGPPGGASSSGTAPAVTQKLYEIAARLQNIEHALHVSPTYTGDGSPLGGGTDSRSPSRRSMSPGSSDDESNEADELDKEKANPIHEINDSIEMVVGKVEARVDGSADDYGAPDVINRGTLTSAECQELFEFFFCSIHPWVMMLSLDEDRDAMVVRSRSSLLFHTILCLSTSFSSPFPSALHTTLVTYVNAIFAPQILNPQPHELTTDFLRAVDLLNLYKPTQFSTRRAEGKDIAESMRASKVNGLASWMLQGILARTAERVDLASVLSKFSRAYSASASGIAIPKPLLRDLRLYYWLLSNDVHGNVQSGRRCNMEGAAALTTTRLFSSLQLQPYDMRLAASVEMFEVARPILRSFSYERTRRIARPDLERYNAGMAAWEEFWLPMLQQQLGVDPLAMSVMCPFAWFITLQFNAAAYVAWKEKRFSSSDSSDGNEPAGKPEPGQPKPKRARIEGRGLTQWEFEGLERCVKAAEGLVFTLSEESRVPGGWRQVQWEEAERADGWRKLILDTTIVELSKWGMDAITCVAYIFPLVFLCKLVNEGILTPDLVLAHNPTMQQPWRYTQKLPRLLELGAVFLDAVGLNPHHPARAQAQVLRALLESGVKGMPPSPQPVRPNATGSVSTGNINVASQSIPPSGAGSTSYSSGLAPQLQAQPWQSSIKGAPLNVGGQFAGQSAALGASTAGANPNAMLGAYTALGPSSGGATSGATGGSMSSAAPGRIDTALTNVLNGFDPMWTETGGTFWDWGQLGEMGGAPAGAGAGTGGTTPGGGLDWGTSESTSASDV